MFTSNVKQTTFFLCTSDILVATSRFQSTFSQSMITAVTIGEEREKRNKITNHYTQSTVSQAPDRKLAIPEQIIDDVVLVDLVGGDGHAAQGAVDDLEDLKNR